MSGPGNLVVGLFNDTMVSITDIRCHEDRHCRMRSLPKAPTHDQCRELNPRPLDLLSTAVSTRPRDPTGPGNMFSFKYKVNTNAHWMSVMIIYSMPLVFVDF